jgi:hypothetical protein
VLCSAGGQQCQQEDEVKFHYMLHASLDAVEEKVCVSCGGGATAAQASSNASSG